MTEWVLMPTSCKLAGAGGWWVDGGWWVVVGGWWLVVGGWLVVGDNL